jgi:hypothetical protein
VPETTIPHKTEACLVHACTPWTAMPLIMFPASRVPGHKTSYSRSPSDLTQNALNAVSPRSLGLPIVLLCRISSP